MRRAVPLMGLVALACGSPPPAPTLDGTGSDAWTFALRVSGAADLGCDEVSVRSPRATVRADRAGGHFVAVVPVDPGDNDVVAICRDGDRTATSGSQRWRVRLVDRPRAAARVRHGPDGGLVLDAGGSRPGRATRLAAYRWTAQAGNPGPVPGLPAAGAEVAIARPDAPGEYRVDLDIVDDAGHTDRAAVRFAVDGGEAVAPDPTRDHPAWVDDAVVYGVAPYFFGGRLTDVVPRLDALVDLGVTVLWLSPVMTAAPDDYGYATLDHLTVRDDFGGAAALHTLVDQAHRRGLRVILDIVANHTARAHPYATARPELYERGPDGGFTHYFDWAHLPNLDHDHPETTAFLIETHRFWVDTFDVDGFRADAAWGPARRRPTFWRDVRAALAETAPDLLWLAEAHDLDADGFDASYDWTESLGTWAWREAFDAQDGQALGAAIAASAGSRSLVLRFLDNNDTGPRFATRYGPSRVPAAAAILFTVPGIPSLWTGSETGAALEPYQEGPVQTWDDPHGLLSVYRRLAHLRHATPALRDRAITVVPATPPSVVAYVRPGPPPILVVANLAGTAVDATLAPGPGLPSGPLRDLYNHDVVTPRITPAGLRVPVPASGFRILRR
jgi:cyclomaltodextrinase